MPISTNQTFGHSLLRRAGSTRRRNFKGPRHDASTKKDTERTHLQQTLKVVIGQRGELRRDNAS